MKMRYHAPRRAPARRSRDLERPLRELSATAEALSLSVRRFAVPTLQLAVDILVDAQEVAHGIRHASLELTRQLQRFRVAGPSLQARRCRLCGMRKDARRRSRRS